METVGADADLGAETEFEAIIEAGGRVPEDGGAVDFGEEAAGGRFVGGHDRVAVAGAIAVDDGDGLLEGIDNADGDDVVEELGGVVRFRGRDEGDDGGQRVEGLRAGKWRLGDWVQGRGGENGGARGVATELDVFGAEGAGDGWEEFIGDAAMDEELFGGIAGAGARDFRVERDRLGHREVGGGIGVDKTYALVVFDDGDGGVLRDEADEALAPARDDTVDERIQF